jgi:hypothetical protein
LALLSPPIRGYSITGVRMLKRIVKVAVLTFFLSMLAPISNANSQINVGIWLISGRTSEIYGRQDGVADSQNQIQWVTCLESPSGSMLYPKRDDLSYSYSGVINSGTYAPVWIDSMSSCTGNNGGNQYSVAYNLTGLTAGTTYQFTINGSIAGSSFTSSKSFTTLGAPTPSPTPAPTFSETSTVSSTPTPSETRTVSSTPTPTPTPTPKSNPNVTAVEDDGEEEDPSATLGVSKRSNGKYQLVISSNVSEERLIISATRKGFKSITYRVNTNDSGDASIITSRNLSGFTLTLRYNGDNLDKVKAK